MSITSMTPFFQSANALFLPLSSENKGVSSLAKHVGQSISKKRLEVNRGLSVVYKYNMYVTFHGRYCSPSHLLVQVQSLKT